MRVQITLLVDRKDKVLLDALSILLQMAQPVVLSSALAMLLESLSPDDRNAVLKLVERSVSRTPESHKPEDSASYEFRRLCFKKRIIDGLGQDDLFRVDTPMGSFEMTRAQFERDFRNVLDSESYKQTGMYHYPKIPQKAERYRCSSSPAESRPGER
jgi:hypothetical protein